MRKTFAVLVVASILFAARGEAQVVASAPPPPPPPKPTLHQLGMIIYPSKGQAAQQQALDESACYSWAESQTGLYLQAGSVNTDAAAKAAGQQAAAATEGAAVAGAAKGAIAGVAIGAVAGDANKGAAIGAVAGAMGGRRARKQATQQAANQGAQQAVAQNKEMIGQFTKAAAVCLEGRGYSAK